MVTPGSSFEQTIMGRSPRCYIPSFVEIGRAVPVKKIFEWFSPYMGMAAILGHVTSIIINFHFHVPKSLHTKFGLKRPSGF